MKNLFLSTLLFFILITPQAMAEDGFSDVFYTTPHADAIRYIKAKGYVKGYSDGSFAPEKTINRYDFTKIIIAAKFPLDEILTCDMGKYSFPDVPQNQWFTPYVCTALKNGVINGYGDGTFKGQNTVSAIEAIKIILTTYATELGIAIESVPGESWYVPYLRLAAKAAMISDPQQIDIDEKITRGDMASFIFKRDNAVAAAKTANSTIDLRNTLEEQSQKLDEANKKLLGDQNKLTEIELSRTYQAPWGKVEDFDQMLKYFKMKRRDADFVTLAEGVAGVINSFYADSFNDLATAFANKDKPTFLDVSPDQWFFKHVEIANSLDIMQGFSDWNFHPFDKLSRAEALKIVLLTGDIGSLLEPTPPFTDVLTSDWSYEYIASAFNHCIIHGVTPTTIEPNQPISNAEFAAVIENAIKVANGIDTCISAR